MRCNGEADRERVRRELKRKAKAVFSACGLKGATVRQLAKAAGISSGGFYSYYPSKESLFLDILSAEIEAAKERNMARVAAESGDPRQMIRSFLLNAIEDIRANPVLARMLIPEDRDAMARMFAEEPDGEGGRADMGSALAATAAQWKAGGVPVAEEPDVVAAIVRSLFILTAHREEIGEDVFPVVMERMADYIAAGLTGGVPGGRP
jgi:AcrR family transcriptional regulator